MKCLCT